MWPFWKKIRDPYPGEEWEVWYRDTFDHDARPGIDARGRGLAGGLKELWARYLFEGAGSGFSDFNLRSKTRNIRISGDRKSMKILRERVFGDKKSTTRGYVAEADPALLDRVASAHACNIDDGEIVDRILKLAAETGSAGELMKELDKLIEK